jgi:SAM-dependent methyltransferase
MKREDIRILIIKIVDMFPVRMQNTILKTIIEARYLIFKIKFAYAIQKKRVNPAKIYWVSPNRITKCLSPENRKGYFNSEKMRGRIIGGDWDRTNYEFANTIDVYEAFRKRVRERIDWQDTEYYKRILKEVKSGNYLYGIKNKADLDERCKYLDSLYENIKKEGYRLNRNIYHKNITFDEIDVCIGRNGDYIFRDGIHRLSIAKIIGLKYVPVTVFIRHKEWQAFRDFLFAHARRLGGQLYQPPVHPDLVDIPHNMEHEDLWKAIKLHLGKETGVMLDIGANIGFFCHKFEDLGYQCYAIERDPILCQIMKKIKKAENKKFQIIERSVFEVEFIRNIKFDVVLALNIFHHFLKTKTTYLQLIDLLKNLKTAELFFESHRFEEEQMRDAYANYRETEFVNFLLEHTSLSKSELIYVTKSGRHVFKLFK